MNLDYLVSENKEVEKNNGNMSQRYKASFKGLPLSKPGVIWVKERIKPTENVGIHLCMILKRY